MRTLDLLRPTKEDKIRVKLEQRKEVTSEGCWLYTGTILQNGYAQIKYKGEAYLVHRLSLEIYKGIVFREGEQANHIRECPNKHCFNPDHLYIGTHQDNMDDRSFKCRKCGREKIKGRCTYCLSLYNAEYYSKNNSNRKNYGRMGG